MSAGVVVDVPCRYCGQRRLVDEKNVKSLAACCRDCIFVLGRREASTWAA